MWTKYLLKIGEIPVNIKPPHRTEVITIPLWILFLLHKNAKK